jgi:hypothetical protein
MRYRIAEALSQREGDMTMTYSFRPAIKSQAKPLVGLYAESGAGKTLSALYLALGFTGDGDKIGMLETEAGRGEAYVNSKEFPHNYNVLSLRDDFSPKNYNAAIKAAEAAKLQALIIDSASHEWEGAGGVLSMAAKNQEDGKKGPLVWQRPKMDHQSLFMLPLLQTPIPLVIVCMRAKFLMEEVVRDGKKEWAKSKELSPKQSEDILFEMFVHGWIGKDDHKFHGTKYTLGELRQVIVDGEPISIETGKRLQQWAAGGRSQHPGSPPSPPATSAGPSASDRVAKVLARFDGFTQEQVEQALGKSIGQASKADLEAAWEKLAGAEI